MRITLGLLLAWAQGVDTNSGLDLWTKAALCRADLESEVGAKRLLPACGQVAQLKAELQAQKHVLEAGGSGDASKDILFQSLSLFLTKDISSSHFGN